MTKFVFIDSKGKLLTQRINQTDCRPTIAWLGMMQPHLDLIDNIVGSAPISPNCSNIDVVYDEAKSSPNKLLEGFINWARSYDFNPNNFVKQAKNIVYFKCPIVGTPSRGFVQVNLYPVKNVEFSRYMMRLQEESIYKCRERNVLLNSIAYTMGQKLNPLQGLHDTTTKKPISYDINDISVNFFGPSARSADMGTVERLLKMLAKDKERTRKIELFTQHLNKEGIPFVDDYYEPEIHYMARLRDRIVHKGYQPLLEGNARIEHLEDLVFERGSKGVKEALRIMKYSSENGDEAISTKIDGKPCIVFGRNDKGKFILTDKSGFNAKTYDGLAETPEQMRGILTSRGPGREELIEIYNKLFPLLDAALPKGFRGFIKGDLMYSSKPKEIKGAHTFRPNFIEYKIPVDSDLGKKIANSEVGIALHTMINHNGSSDEPLTELKHKNPPGLLLMFPSDFESGNNFKVSKEIVKEIKSLLKEHGDEIDLLFDPSELRSQKITDLPQICKRFINSRISSNFDDLLNGFLDWIEENVGALKYKRINEYLDSPSSNGDALKAVFEIFLLLHELKMESLLQLDRRHPGHEGWVLSSPDGRAKLVDRFVFSHGNKIFNNN